MLKNIIDNEPSLQGKSYADIAEWLNEREEVDNEPQPKIPKPLTGVDELFAIIMKDAATFEQDMEALGKCAQFLEIGKTFSEYCGISYGGPLAAVTVLLQNPVFGLSSGTAEKVQVRLREEQLDENWQPTVLGESRAEKLGLNYPITAEQVQESVNVA